MLDYLDLCAAGVSIWSDTLDFILVKASKFLPPACVPASSQPAVLCMHAQVHLAHGLASSTRGACSRRPASLNARLWLIIARSVVSVSITGAEAGAAPFAPRNAGERCTHPDGRGAGGGRRGNAAVDNNAAPPAGAAPAGAASGGGGEGEPSEAEAASVGMPLDSSAAASAGAAPAGAASGGGGEEEPERYPWCHVLIFWRVFRRVIVSSYCTHVLRTQYSGNHKVTVGLVDVSSGTRGEPSNKLRPTCLFQIPP